MLHNVPLGPDFLVVGAQKCGTTTLWEDLRTHPDASLSDKESNGLLDPNVTSTSGRRRYSALFVNSTEGRVRGEVCTTYTMLPENPEVVSRALSLNPRLKVVYIVRNPIERVISHHHHDYSLGLCGPDINAEVHRHAALVENSRYGTQIAPWVEAFGVENLLIVKFEDYVSNRDAGFAEVLGFLDLSHRPLNDQAVHNASDSKRVAVGMWSTISESATYRQFLRPLLTESLRRRLMAAVLPHAPQRPGPPSIETQHFLIDQLDPEVKKLAEIADCPPLWDLSDPTSVG